MPFAWSPAVLDDLHRLFVGQRLSAAKTARALGEGVTRHAVLGKVQRLGWVRPERPKAGRPASDTPRPAPRLVARRGRFGRIIPLPELREVEVASTPRLWTERQDGECAFPIGEPEAPGMQLSCCAKVVGRGDYCPAHRALMRTEERALTPDEVQSALWVAKRSR